MQRTNTREVTAFFAAQAIVVGAHFFLAPMLLTPVYAWLRDAGGEQLSETATSIVSFMLWVVALPLFLLLRGRLDDTRRMVAGRGGSDAVTSSIGEAVPYLSTVLIVMVVVWILSGFVSPKIQAALRHDGYLALTGPASFALTVGSAVVVFLMFIALRGAMPRSAIPEVFD